MNRNQAAALLVPAAAAVALALVTLRLHFQPPTVPLYAFDRSTDGAVLSQADTFDVKLRPAAPVRGVIGARGFLVRDEEVRPWDPPFHVDPDGSVRIEGQVAVLFAGVPPGPWTLAIAVGRPEVLPTAPRDVLRARTDDGSPASWRLLRERVLLGGSAGG
ncbi:MAG TPA: hypothetical protein VKU41_03890 [Polyangiaceae bacterium]|nr:hypothetical protein [Polyangiaceae bacterium]